MPSKSPAQKRLMAAAAHDARFARKVGVPQRVAREFHAADKLKEPHDVVRARAMKKIASRRYRQLKREIG